MSQFETPNVKAVEADTNPLGQTNSNARLHIAA